jgi:hypothetical protein
VSYAEVEKSLCAGARVERALSYIYVIITRPGGKPFKDYEP